MKPVSEEVAMRLADNYLQKAIAAGTFLNAPDGERNAQKAVSFFKTFVDELTVLASLHRLFLLIVC